MNEKVPDSSEWKIQHLALGLFQRNAGPLFGKCIKRATPLGKCVWSVREKPNDVYFTVSCLNDTQLPSSAASNLGCTGEVAHTRRQSLRWTESHFR